MDDKSYMTIKLGTGTVADKLAANLVSVSLKDSLEAMDSATITYELPEGTVLDVKAPDLDLYGKTWEITLFDKGAKGKSYGGDIVGISWTRSGGAPRQVTFTCLSQMHRLKKGKKPLGEKGARIWRSKGASDVVKDVAGAWQLGSADIQTTAALPKDFEWKSDDAALLKKLAQDVGYVVRLNFESGKHNVVFVSPDNVDDTVVDLAFGVDILDISGNHNLNGCITEVSVYTKDQVKAGDAVPKKFAADALKATNDAAYIGGVLAKRMSLMAQEAEVKDGSDNRTDGSGAEELAKGMVTDGSMSFVDGSMTCRFTPKIVCGCTLNVTGAGWPLDGKFIAKEVTHSFDASGYRTTVSFQANSIKMPAGAVW